MGMTSDEACKWLMNLRNNLWNLRYEYLWPYAEAIDCIITALEDGSMLQAQKPRVLTLEQVFCSKDPFYIEYEGGCITCWAVSRFRYRNSMYMATQHGSRVELYNDQYGNTWRC